MLDKLMEMHNPDFVYNAIQLNANVICNPHYDRNNKGLSYALALGDFKGGGIEMYADADDKKPTILRNHNKWVKMNG